MSVYFFFAISLSWAFFNYLSTGTGLNCLENPFTISNAEWVSDLHESLEMFTSRISIDCIRNYRMVTFLTKILLLFSGASVQSFFSSFRGGPGLNLLSYRSRNAIKSWIIKSIICLYSSRRPKLWKPVHLKSTFEASILVDSTILAEENIETTCVIWNITIEYKKV